MLIGSSFSENGVEITISGANLISGYDIVGMRVDGHELPPTRVGEFETEAAAKQAALARAEQARKGR